MSDFKHVDLTHMIIGCAMKVHRILGPGFQEIIYKRCLVIELEKSGLHCTCEIEKEILYEGANVGSRRLDLLVDDKVIVELKAVTAIEPLFRSQIINYLKVFKIEVGLLLNFGGTSLHFQRFVNTP